MKTILATKFNYFRILLNPTQTHHKAQLSFFSSLHAPEDNYTCLSREDFR